MSNPRASAAVIEEVDHYDYSYQDPNERAECETSYGEQDDQKDEYKQ